MKMTTIEVSAQFGGLDASKAVLPHFRALKAALLGKSFTGFPFAKLGFILRVDGEINAYGKSGAGNIEFDRMGGYVSVDIGITREDWVGGEAQVCAAVTSSIMSSVGLLKELGNGRLKGVDWGEVEVALQSFSYAYEVQIQGSGA